MNVRMTIDVPTQYLPKLENSLARQGLAIIPFVKNGQQRWQLAPRPSSQATSIPETIIAAGVEA